MPNKKFVFFLLSILVFSLGVSAFAADVTIKEKTGDPKTVGSVVYATYDSTALGAGTAIQWFVYEDATFPNPLPTPKALTEEFTLSATDVGYYVFAQITVSTETYKSDAYGKIVSASTGKVISAVDGAFMDLDREIIVVPSTVSKLFYRFNGRDTAFDPGKGTGTWKPAILLQNRVGNATDIGKNYFSIEKVIKQGLLEIIAQESMPLDRAETATTYWLIGERDELPGDKITIDTKGTTHGYSVADKVYVSNVTDEMIFTEANTHNWNQVTVTEPKMMMLNVLSTKVEYWVKMRASLPESGVTGTITHVEPGNTVAVTPASKYAKVKVSETQKAPSIKVDYNKETISLKPVTHEYKLAKNEPWIEVGSSGDKYTYTVNGKSVFNLVYLDEDLYGETIIVRVAASAKKPASWETTLKINERGEAPSTSQFSISNDGKKLLSSASAGTLMYYQTGERGGWKKGTPKPEEGVLTAVEVRHMAIGNYGASEPLKIAVAKGGIISEVDSSEEPGTGKSSVATITAAKIGSVSVTQDQFPGGDTIASSTALTASLTPAQATNATLTITTTDSKATVVYTKTAAAATPSGATEIATSPATAISSITTGDVVWIKVTAEDGTTVKFFKITVTVS